MNYLDMSNGLYWDNVLLHIGLPRCASTYLQEIFYPSLPVDIFDNWGCNTEKLNNEVYDLIRSKDYDRNFLVEWINGNTAKKNDTLIISQETLGWDDVAFITGENLYDFCPDAEVLIVIREQFSFLISNYCYKVTTGCFHETRNIDEYLSYLDNINYYNMLEYHKIVGYYQKLFGRDKVHVLPVEMLQREPETFQNIILNVLSICRNDIEYREKANVNRSFKSKKVVNNMVHLNKAFSLCYKGFSKLNPSAYWDNKFRYAYYHLKSPIAGMFGIFENGDFPKVEISDIRKRELSARFSDSNKVLEKLIDLPLDEYGYII